VVEVSDTQAAKTAATTGDQVLCGDHLGRPTAPRALPDELHAVAHAAKEFTAEFRLAKLTFESYRQGWTTFVETVTALKHEPLPASPQCLVDFLMWVCDTDSPKPEPKFSPGYVGVILSAVIQRHLEEGHPHPFTNGDLSDARAEAMAVLRQERPPMHTLPITVAQLHALASVPPPVRNRTEGRRELAFLLTELHGWTEADLLNATLHRRTLSADGRQDVRVDCTCRGDVSMLCVGCAFGAVPRRGNKIDFGGRLRLRAQMSRLEELLGGIAPGAKRELLALAVIRPRIPVYLRTQAWITLSFDRGLRAHDCRLGGRRDLSEVTFDEERGYRIVLQRSKEDPLGETADLAVYPQANSDFCPVRALDAWLAVRDAQAALRGVPDLEPLFNPVSQSGRIIWDRKLSRHTDLHIWRERRTAAGLPELTQHGLRAGFIVEAHRQGMDREAISFTVRHSRPATTDGYLRGEDPRTRDRLQAPKADDDE
jgi:hypothetical protein